MKLTDLRLDPAEFVELVKRAEDYVKSQPHSVCLSFGNFHEHFVCLQYDTTKTAKRDVTVALWRWMAAGIISFTAMCSMAKRVEQNYAEPTEGE